MIGRRVLLTSLVVAAAAPLVGCAQDPEQRGAPTGAGTVETYLGDERKPAPAMSGELVNGERFDLEALRGDVVVVNIWGSWCAPCRAEAPDLEATYQATKDLGVSFVGVAVRDGRDAAGAFIDGFGLTYPSLFDPASRVVLAFRDVPPSVVPATILIDRDHRVAAVFRKVVTQRELEAAVRAVATEDRP